MRPDAPSYDVATVRAQFPALAQTVHGKRLAYLDSAATALKPQAVLNALATAATRVPVSEILTQRLAVVERLLEEDEEPVHQSQARALRGALADAPSSRASTRSFLRSLDDLERAAR